ncbi:GGDEF domain-containing protein [Actinoplanes subglobosus]|uniref:GGDEF domain-containing protein n=1 Tax=Actinoplanes subglobosus TaxID=1547892 RepID=A0ABV8J7A3_9ACTN
MTALLAGILLGYLIAWPRLRTLTGLRTALAEARQLADHDRLTGLLNRWAAARLVFASVEVGRRPTLLALIDLDNFKTINDGYGYQAGDQLLRIVAARLTQAVLPHRGFTARLGGDEFLIVLPHTSTGAIGDALARLAAPAVLHTDDGPISVIPAGSAGITVYAGAGPTTFVDLLHEADVALHHAKHQRGSHRTFQTGMSMPGNAGRHGPRRRDQHPTGGQQ